MKKSLPQTLIAITLALFLLFPSPSLAATSGGFFSGFFSSLYSTVVSLFTFSADDASPSSSPEPSASPSESYSPSYSPTTSRSVSVSPSPSSIPPGVCCIATYDDKLPPYCEDTFGSSRLDSEEFKKQALEWLYNQKGCDHKLPVMTISDFQSDDNKKLRAGRCTLVRFEQFQHGPAAESLIKSIEVCLKTYGCDVNAHSYSCMSFSDITAANVYIEELKKSTPSGVKVVITGNQLNGLVNTKDPQCINREEPNNKVTYTVTRTEISCSFSDCKVAGIGECAPPGGSSRCMLNGKETTQYCCWNVYRLGNINGAQSIGTWGKPGQPYEQACPKPVGSCTGTDPLVNDEDHLLVQCPNLLQRGGLPYSIVKTCTDNPCQFTCSSIAEYKDGKCVLKSTPSPTPTPSASYSPSPSYSPTYTPTYTPTYSYSPSPSYTPSYSYSPSPTYSPNSSYSPSQTVSATPKKSNSFMASVASGFKSIIDGVVGMFK